VEQETVDCVKTGNHRFPEMSEREILIRAQNGDKKASEYLLHKYRSLVRYLINTYFLKGAEKDDLFQIGMIGLWQAVIDYRCDISVSFNSFARICIQRHIITAIKSASRMKQYPLNGYLSMDRNMGDEEWTRSLEETLSLDEIADPEEMILRNEDTRRVKEMLQQLLSTFEWKVLAGYQVGKSYQEIARELRVKTKSVDNALVRIKKKVVEVDVGKASIPDLLAGMESNTMNPENM
jgi:RNA polymerase sporulation-specific sigma factor